MKYRLLAFSILAICLASTSFAQRSSLFSGARGQSLSITGSIQTIDGHAVRDARVEIHDLMTGSLISAGYSLPNGTFTFYNIPAGHYEIRSVNGLQEARERVDLDSVDQQVTLKIADAAGSPTGGNGATVSVAEMRVPDKARKEFEKAQEAFGKRKIDDARARCAKALSLAPTYSRALTLSALFDLSDNKLEDAAQKAEQAVKSDYGYSMGYIVLASVYNSLKRYDDSIRTLDRAIPLAPNSWQAHFELSKAQLGKGDFQKALAAIDRAIQSGPAEYAPVHLVRAHALLGLKAYDQAMLELEKYVSVDPKGADVADVRKTLDDVKAFVATSKK
jgi:tetratricopeptide (TPR) repeat protein